LDWVDDFEDFVRGSLPGALVLPGEDEAVDADFVAVDGQVVEDAVAEGVWGGSLPGGGVAAGVVDFVEVTTHFGSFGVCGLLWIGVVDVW
jgi:hypothetical protein